MRRARRAIATLSAAALIIGLTVAATAPRATALDNGLARTPPMGWNGYNHFSINVTSSIVRAEARELVDSGLKAAGYTYVNLDGGWDLMQRDAAGQLQPDPAKFPEGIKPLADYVHSLGLKFGIYTSIGTANCKNTAAGSYGHYEQDARTFASWGVDYVKVDWCEVPVQNYPGMTDIQIAQTLGAQMRDAVAATGRPMVFDYNVNGICPDDCNDWEWGSGVANVWRISRDISDSYDKMVRNLGRDVPLSSYAGPGGWNDPDMLEVGNGGMTTTEYQSQFSLWAEMAAPLVAGNDLTTMTQATRRILTNRAVIAVDQDPLGKQGYPIASVDGHWVLTKPLADGDRAVVLFNQTDTPATITTSATAAGLPAAPAYAVRDLWTHTTTETAGVISAEVPAHAVAMYRVSASPSAAGRYPPRTELGISAARQLVPAGHSTAVSATLTDDGRTSLYGVSLTVQAPQGWSSDPTTDTTFTNVRDGGSVRATWRLTTPADAQPGRPAVTVQAEYSAQNSHGTSRASTPLLVPFPSLAKAYDNTGISDDTDVDSADFDGVGDSYSEQGLSAAGLAPDAAVSHDTVGFTWPAVPAGQPDNVLAQGQTVLVTGSGATLGFLGSSSGTSSGTGTVYYTDGTTRSFTIALPDWWSRPGSGNDIVAATGYVNSQGIGGRPRGQRQHTVYVFYAGVPLTPGKTVQAVTLPTGGSTATDGRISGIHVFTIGIG